VLDLIISSCTGFILWGCGCWMCGTGDNSWTYYGIRVHGSIGLPSS